MNLIQMIKDRVIRRTKVRLISRGFPQNTKLFIGGRDVPVTFLRVFSIYPGGDPVKVEVVLFLDEIDLEFDGDILLVAHEETR